MFKLALASAALASAAAAPAGWTLRSETVGEVELTFAIDNPDPAALKAAFEEHTRVGGPARAHYSLEEIAHLVGNPRGAARVEQVLLEAGATSVQIMPAQNYVKARLPEAAAEKLMSANYALFEHEETGTRTVRTEEHTVPASIREHVDFVTGRRFPPAHFGLFVDESAEGEVTPASLREQYNVDVDTASSDASISLLGAIGQSYSPDDIAAFDSMFGLDSTDINVVGPNYPKLCSVSLNSCAEATLDLSVAAGIATGADTYFWSIEASSADPFVDWLVAMTSAEDTPQVASASYGADETAMPSDEMDRFDEDAQAIALKGTSIFVSSGDDGAPGSNLRTDTSVCDGAFAPSWPATSPYVTSVGATAVAGGEEVVCQSDIGAVITSGGGFSTYYDQPDYQGDAVGAYLKQSSLPDSSKFNDAGRAYPDVALNGFNYTIVVGGQTVGVSGTSASAPAMASMVTLINSERLAAGKQSLGFLNNDLYDIFGQSGQKVFQDITSGDNNCAASNTASGANCCDEAFEAVEGFDASTGLGSVDFSALHAALLDA